MPIPVSATSISTKPETLRDETVTTPPWLLYLTALSMRLLRADTSWRRSPTTVSGTMQLTFSVTPTVSATSR